MPVGLESAHGFGDLCFNSPLIKALHEKYQDDVWVATGKHCKDALYNTPWIARILECGYRTGVPMLKEMGCDPVHQITQEPWFFEFKKDNPQHSLIDTPIYHSTRNQLSV
jgi:hypothetical protein